MSASGNSQDVRTVGFGAVLFIGFGLILTPLLVSMHWRAQAMRTWPAAQAVVVSTGVEKVHHKGEGWRYQHEISYRYHVDGAAYTGSQVSYGGRPPEWKTEAEALQALPKVGDSIQVFYDPRNPIDSVIHLVRTPETEVYFVIGVCGFVGLFGAGVLALGLYRMRRGY